MNSSIESSPSPLVVFGPDHIDTSRAEMLVQCLNDKIKEKRFKLQKIIGLNEEKKKRNELMKNEKLQLTNKLANIEQENIVREQQLQSEQTRIKELQYNIQMLDDHNHSIKRDCLNEEQKYEQEKTLLINKFERTKQQWTEIFKPQYEQSKVYRYLKQGDLAYNSFVERKEALLNTQKLAYKDYSKRQEEFCNDKNLQLSILTIAKYFILRRDQLNKIQEMKDKLLELEIKQKQLIETKLDKMKAWESVYTQPVKRDLMDFCLQTNIDQALTLSFNQIQQDSYSQPMTPIIPTQNESIQFQSEEQITITKPTVTFQLPASTITIIPNTMENISMESNRTSAPSVLHLTTAIDDDDDEVFSTSRRQIPTIQLEQMSISDAPPSTQAFVVSSTPVTSSNTNIDREVSSISSNDQSLTQAFNTNSVPTSVESIPVHDSVTSTLNVKIPESLSIPTSDKTPSTVTFQLPPSRIQTRSMASTSSSIQPQVTSNDVQQMLLTFSPDPSSIHEEQPQPMEHDIEQSQQQQQQRPTFSMVSSIESATSLEDGYTGFNYNFGFDGNATGNVSDGRGFISPVNFGDWTNLGSPTTTSNNQFSSFLQQTNSGDNTVDTSFSFAAFNYGDLGNSETSTNGAFNSFFFGNNENSTNNEQIHDGNSN